ncbi:Hypothetical predicted protein [Olea europaea subsp. europaea]|uniref:Uncharacterized protein n=1 Tax=Olea europaea subsp. europaea TaxID=158383 RepID=A0A8S0QYA9_OLEEU|nr:Hypothetical predicted protein [Olea europaea subsp. europaea]
MSTTHRKIVAYSPTEDTEIASIPEREAVSPHPRDAGKKRHPKSCRAFKYGGSQGRGGGIVSIAHKETSGRCRITHPRDTESRASTHDDNYSRICRSLSVTTKNRIPVLLLWVWL